MGPQLVGLVVVQDLKVDLLPLLQLGGVALDLREVEGEDLLKMRHSNIPNKTAWLEIKERDVKRQIIVTGCFVHVRMYTHIRIDILCFYVRTCYT